MAVNCCGGTRLANDVSSTSMVKCLLFRCRNVFGQFQAAWVPSPRTMDFAFWQQTILKGVCRLDRKKDSELIDVDLVIFDNLSTLCTNGSESASEAWVPMQNWLLKLRRQGIAVLLVHHAGTNGRQRGTSRREDALDTVIALRRPEDYSPEQGAQFEVHFEKLRNRVDGDGAVPFEAKLKSLEADQGEGVRWRHLVSTSLPPEVRYWNRLRWRWFVIPSLRLRSDRQRLQAIARAD